MRALPGVVTLALLVVVTCDPIARLVDSIKDNSVVWQNLNARNVSSILPRTIMLPMRDDVKLYTRYWGLDNEPRPTVIIRSPYGPEGTENLAYLYIPAGFSIVMQNQRGTGSSDGNWTFWETAPFDGLDTMDWIASQPWSTGKVYQMGASADGILSYLDMKEPQPHLYGQWLLFSNSMMYYTVFQEGMAFRKQLVSHWLKHMQIYRPDAPSYVNFTIYHEGLDYWWDRATLQNLSNVNFPGVHLAGWYDIFLDPMIRSFHHYQELSAPGGKGNQKLIIGPRGHCFFFVDPKIAFPDDLYDFVWAYEESLRIFDSVDPDLNMGAALFSGSKVSQLETYTLYVMGPLHHEPSNKDRIGMYWTTLPAWPEVTNLTLYMMPNRTLEPTPPVSGETKLTYVFAPEDPVPTLGGNNLFLSCGPVDQTSVESRPDVLLFETNELIVETAILGNILVQLTVSSNCTDTDFTAKVTDVYPDGKSILLGDALFRMRWRNSMSAKEEMVPGQKYEITITIWSLCYVFAPGHRIRVAVSSSNYPRFGTNLNNGGLVRDTEPVLTAENNIHLGKDVKAEVLLPTVSLSSLPNNVK